MNSPVDPVRTNVDKLLIVAYEDKMFRKPLDKKHVSLPINPETYSNSYKINLDEKQGFGQEGTDPKYRSTAPEDLKLDFTLDGTGTVLGYFNNDNLTVQEQFVRLREVVYAMNGKKHRPNWI